MSEVLTQHSRFRDAPWFPKPDDTIPSILIGGAGGIGSWLTLMLCRIGYEVTVFDFDKLEVHNLGGQLLSRAMVGQFKVLALEDIVSKLCHRYDLNTSTDKINENTFSNRFVISAFDNMLARTHMFNSWVRENTNTPEAIFIDGRLEAEVMTIFCVRNKPEDIANYRLHLFDDSKIEDAPCTMKQTSHSAAMIASHMTAFFTNHYTNVVEGDETREVPFRWYYHIPLNYLE